MAVNKVGVYAMPLAEYLADPCQMPSLSSSIAHTLLACSPRHAWTAHPRLNPAYEPDAEEKFDLGSAAHAYLLEGETGFAIVHARDWRTKDAQATRDAARADGKIPLLAEQWERVQQMAEAARDQLGRFEDAPIPFTGGRAEQTLVWREGAVWCRARLDWLHDDRETVDDLKTTSGTANPEVFSRALYGMGYDVQVAFYLRGLTAVFGAPRGDRWFRFVIQETFPPYAVSVVSLAPDALALAAQKVDYAIQRWADCLRDDVWPSYPTRTVYLEMPAWEAVRWGERTYSPPTVEDDGRPIGELL